MRPFILLQCVFALTLAAGCSSPDTYDDRLAAEETERALSWHDWHSVSYPDIEVPWASGRAEISALPSFSPRGLDFEIRLFGPGRSGQKVRTPAAGELTVRLHTEDGRILEPIHGDGLVHTWMVSGGGATAFVSFVFPWIDESSGAASFELSLPEKKYWLPVPYGFFHDPRQAPSKARVGSTAAPPTSTAVALPWRSADYRIPLPGRDELGEPRLLAFSLSGNGGPTWRLKSPLRGGELIGVKAVFGNREIPTARETESSEKDRRFVVDGDPPAASAWGEVIVHTRAGAYRKRVPGSLFAKGAGAR